MEKEGKMITDWLDQNGDKEVEQFIEKNLAITEKVRVALEQKGWSKFQLAEAMGKNPSEVSKWLSGMHNLTLKSIVKMELALYRPHGEITKLRSEKDPKGYIFNF